jgi:hypothetical protein
MPLAYLLNVNNKVQKIMDKRLNTLEFQRVLIPKDGEL